MTKAWAVAMLLCVFFPQGARAQETQQDGPLTLTQAIDVGLSREPSTRAAAADVDVVRGMKVQAGARSNPVVSLERRREPGGTDSATEASVEWPLDLFRRSARVAVADAEIVVAERVSADVRRNLAADIAEAYGRVAAAVRQLALTDEVLAAVNGQLDTLRARVAQGSAPALERDMLEVGVRRLQADRLAQVGRVDVAVLRLKRLLGMPPDAPLRVAQTLEELVAGDAASVSTDAVALRPDVEASEARVRLLDTRIQSLRTEARPDVTLFGSYMRMDAGFPQQGFSEDGHLERVRGQFNYVAAGVMVTIPLFNRQQGSIAAASAERRSAEARAEGARLAAASEAAEAGVQLGRANQAVVQYRENVRPLARRNLEIVRETYQLGRATVFDVLAEQQRYLETEQAYTETLIEAYDAGVSLSRARGIVR